MKTEMSEHLQKSYCSEHTEMPIWFHLCHLEEADFARFYIYYQYAYYYFSFLYYYY